MSMITIEYICKIISPPIARNWTMKKTACWILPLFDVNPEKQIIFRDSPNYLLYFLKEDRYSDNLILVNPPDKITEEQLKIINTTWNYCIENSLEEFEFVL